jgi:hypothetical protein
MKTKNPPVRNLTGILSSTLAFGSSRKSNQSLPAPIARPAISPIIPRSTTIIAANYHHGRRSHINHWRRRHHNRCRLIDHCWCWRHIRRHRGDIITRRIITRMTIHLVCNDRSRHQSTENCARNSTASMRFGFLDLAPHQRHHSKCYKIFFHNWPSALPLLSTEGMTDPIAFYSGQSYLVI